MKGIWDMRKFYEEIYEIPVSDTEEFFFFFKWGDRNCDYGLRTQYLLKLVHIFKLLSNPLHRQYLMLVYICGYLQ